MFPRNLCFWGKFNILTIRCFYGKIHHRIKTPFKYVNFLLNQWLKHDSSMDEKAQRKHFSASFTSDWWTSKNIRFYTHLFDAYRSNVSWNVCGLFSAMSKGFCSPDYMRFSCSTIFISDFKCEINFHINTIIIWHCVCTAVLFSVAIQTEFQISAL